MPPAKPLTDTRLRSLKNPESVTRLFDGGGLYLEVHPNGARYWRLKYRFGGKEKRLALGVYPEVALKDARIKRDDARRVLHQGEDPGAVRKEEKAQLVSDATSAFRLVAAEWNKRQKASEDHRAQTWHRLEANIFPWLGDRSVDDLGAKDVLDVLRRIEARGALELTQRLRQTCSQIFDFAIASGLTEKNPARALRGALATPPERHLAAVLDPAELGKLLRAIEGYSGSDIVRAALRILPHVFSRPGELRAMTWAELDLSKAEWSLPAERMKMKRPHMVPLSRQVVAIIRDIEPLTRKSKFVFPTPRSNDRCLSENAFTAALRSLGFSGDVVTAHGFRATARTLLDEQLKFRPDIIELQLAHTVKDANGRAYNRTSHIDDRRTMMQAWSDWLQTLTDGVAK